MFDYYKKKLNFDEKKIIQIDHHLAHAASVFYTSKFKESAILIVDGLGSDLETTSYFKGSGEKIKLIEKFKEQDRYSLLGYNKSYIKFWYRWKKNNGTCSYEK